MRPTEFIRPKKTKVWYVKGGLYSWQVCKGKFAAVLEPQNTVCSEFCPDILEILSSAGPCDWVSSGQGLSISSEWEVPVVFWEGAVEGSHPKAHKSVCPIFLSDFGEPRLRRAHWSCLELGWLGHQKFEDGEGGSSPKVGTCQAHRNWGELSLPQIHTTQSLTPIKSARTFISQTQAADFFTGLEFHKVRQQGVWSIGPAHSPRLMLHGGECSTQA